MSQRCRLHQDHHAVDHYEDVIQPLVQRDAGARQSGTGCTAGEPADVVLADGFTWAHGAVPASWISVVAAAPFRAVRAAGGGDLEAGADIEGASDVCAVPDLQAAGATPHESRQALGRHRAGQSASLVSVLYPHRLHETDPGDRVEPEKGVPGDLAVLGPDGQIERRVIERALAQPCLHGGAVPARRSRCGYARDAATTPAEYGPTA